MKNVKQVRLGDVITIQTPKRIVRLKVIGVSSEAWVRREAYEARVIN